MRKLLALLCMVVFLFGTALCEETQAIPPEDTIVEEVFAVAAVGSRHK